MHPFTSPTKSCSNHTRANLQEKAALHKEDLLGANFFIRIASNICSSMIPPRLNNEQLFALV
ncbi:hypothetical protein L195_g040209 [Trifolium pratense]|uniref:Uncharacterized protein n=1 Tax=Trifolium pratense TaxID=57577 RepID=A0A2K3M037_TRIPR|nr:hypothetical protein L195_g040209 [Trifolium pratense]